MGLICGALRNGPAALIPGSGEDCMVRALDYSGAGTPIVTSISAACLLAQTMPGAASPIEPCLGHAGGRYHLAWDGWLSNRPALRAALAMPADPACDRDEAVVAQALIRWKDAALTRLHGAFALAWWDAEAQRLLLACDRSGGRSLYVARGGTPAA